MRNSNALGGTILILAGVIFLLNNLGVLDWLIWADLLQLWPLFLIIVGLNLIFGRSRLSFLAPLLLVVVIGAVIFYPGTLRRGLGTQGEVELSQELELGVRRATFELTLAAADVDIFNVKPEERGMLFSGRAIYRGAPLQVDYRVEGDEAKVKISSIRRHWWFGFRGSSWPAKIGDEVQLGLTELIPLNLEVKSGANDLYMDLSRLQLESLNLDAGASNIRIRFGTVSKEVSATIEGGVSKIVLMLPREAGTRIHFDSGLTSNNLTEAGFEKKDNVYVTPNYSRADRVINIDISIGFGKLEVELID